METPWLLRLNLFQALEFLRQVAVKDQAQEILETYTLSQFSFSPERPSAMCEMLKQWQSAFISVLRNNKDGDNSCHGSVHDVGVGALTR